MKRGSSWKMRDDGILFNIRALFALRAGAVASCACLRVSCAACMPLATISVGATIIIKSFFYFHAIIKNMKLSVLESLLDERL